MSSFGSCFGSLKWLVPKEQKLVSFLQQRLTPAPSGKALRRVLEARLCRVNGVVERFGSKDVQKGSVVELSTIWESILSPHCNKIEILYEEERFLVVNKPVGWVCAEEECRRAFGPKRYLVHRLDKETSGALFIAKSVAARDDLMGLFKEKTVKKTYYALIDGHPKQTHGICKNLLAKKGVYEGQTMYGSASHGTLAETHWSLLWKGADASLVQCEPITGRTHQIRVHMAEMGHPILGDRQYAKQFRSKCFATRPFLHAVRLQAQGLDISAELPPDFCHILQEMGYIPTLV
jgi:RluA family pseudouridine synthase